MLSKVFREKYYDIHSEEDLDRCIGDLKNPITLTLCSLGFLVNSLPVGKLIELRQLLEKQPNLRTLRIIAIVNEVSSRQYAETLTDSFTKLEQLKALHIEGLLSDKTAGVLSSLIRNTKKLSKISVGAFFPGQNCKILNKDEGNSIAEALKENKSLTYLDLQKNNIEPSGIEKIIQSSVTHPSLKTLNLSYNCLNEGKYVNEYLDERILELINKNTKVKISLCFGVISPHGLLELDLTEENIPKMLPYLSSALSIRNLALRFSGSPKKENLQLIASQLNNLPHLNKLVLNGLNPLEFEILCQESLVKHNTLKELIFNTENSYGGSVNGLISLIQENTHLTFLTFSACMRRYWEIDKESACRLGKALEQNRHLIYFDINGTNFYDATIIAEIIKNNNCLKAFRLNTENMFESEGVPIILDALNENKILKSFRFMASERTNVDGLNSDLQKNTTLIDLKLSVYLPSATYHSIEDRIIANRNSMLEKLKFLTFCLPLMFYKEKEIGFIILQTFLNSFERFELEELVSKKPVLLFQDTEISEIFVEDSESSEKQAQPYITQPLLIPHTEQNYSFILKVGASMGAGLGAVSAGTIAILGLLGVISLSGLGIGLVLGAAVCCLGLELFGLYKTRDQNITTDSEIKANATCI
jgi:hypothetical protein